MNLPRLPFAFRTRERPDCFRPDRAVRTDATAAPAL